MYIDRKLNKIENIFRFFQVQPVYLEQVDKDQAYGGNLKAE